MGLYSVGKNGVGIYTSVVLRTMSAHITIAQTQSVDIFVCGLGIQVRKTCLIIIVPGGVEKSSCVASQGYMHEFLVGGPCFESRFGTFFSVEKIRNTVLNTW